MKQPLSLVTGACGFMGTHMVEVLQAAGHRVRATDLESALRSDDRDLGRFPSVLRDLGVETVASDVTRPETLEPAVDGVDYVFHIAALFSHSAPRELLFRVNVQGTRALLESLVPQRGLRRVVVWGAGGVYGFPAPGMNPLHEELPPNPPNNYLVSKAEQERVAMELGTTHGLPYTILRPATVYGPRAVTGGGQLFREVRRMAVVAMPRSFNGRAPTVHVRDVCRAALYLAGLQEAQGEIYNVSDDSTWTTVEVTRYLAELCGRRFFAVPLPVAVARRALTLAARTERLFAKHVRKRPPRLEEDSLQYLSRDFAFSTDKLKATGFRLDYPDPAVGLRETYEWYRQAGWL